MESFPCVFGAWPVPHACMLVFVTFNTLKLVFFCSKKIK
jgi:hypothetical protein